MKKISIFLSSVAVGMLLMMPASAVNDYFTHSDRMASGAQVRAQQFNNVFDSIVTGLDKLPSQAQGNRNTRNFATATGSANAYLIVSALSHITGSYASGQEVVFIAPATNTGPSTLNVSSIGASAIVNNDGSAIAAGVIQNNSMVHVRYNTTRSSWELMGTYILSSGVSVSAFASTLLDDADAAAMLVTLGSTPGTVTPSDAVVVDANKDALGFRKITATSPSGITVTATSTSTTNDDAALYGYSQGATGATFGVSGRAASATGQGVRGNADHATGVNYGGYFSSTSSAGYAGYFVTTAAGGLPIYAFGADFADPTQTIVAAKGSRQLRLNPRTSAAAENPIQQVNDQTIGAYGAGGAIDTGVITIAPYATDPVGIRISSVTDTVTVSGTTNIANAFQLGGVAVTATAAELNHSVGVTSAIQTQLNAKATQTGAETLTNKTLTSPVLNGSLSGTAFLNEPTLVSNSAVAAPSQASVKAYVDANFVSITAPATPDISNTALSTVNWTTANLASLNGTGAKAALVKIVNNTTRTAGAAGQTQVIHLAASGKSGAASGYTDAVSETSSSTSTEATSQADICTATVPLDGSQDFQYAIQRSGSFNTATVEIRVVGYWK